MDITRDVTVAPGPLTIRGAVLERVDLMAATPGDIPDLGIVLAVEGVTVIGPEPAMRPGMFTRVAPR